MYIFSESITF